ncbi:hypothetical protein MHFGQ_07390 [Moorella humiferrea]
MPDGLPEGKRPGKGRGDVWRQFQAQARVEELLFLALSGFRAKKGRELVQVG